MRPTILFIVDVLKRKVSELETLATEIEQLGAQFFQGCAVVEEEHSILENVRDPQDLNLESMRDEDIAWKEYYWDTLKPELKISQRKVIRAYKRWYSLSYELVKDYLPEMISEFNSYYKAEVSHGKKSSSHLGVVDYLKLRYSPSPNSIEAMTESFIDTFEEQLGILLIVPDIAEVRELSLRKLITADVANTEVEQAEMLLSNGFHRAAGSIAGVALELHLKTLCDINGQPYPSKATIQPLLLALQKGGILDSTEIKHIEYLASIRNKCAHPKEVSEAEVQSLIEGVKEII
jgi:hypothetical protein